MKEIVKIMFISTKIRKNEINIYMNHFNGHDWNVHILCPESQIRSVLSEHHSHRV